MHEGVLYLTEQDVVSVLDMPTAIDALHGMLISHGHDKVKNVPKALGTWADGSSMHSLASVMTEGGYCGFKTWVHTKRGGGSMFSLFDSNNGKLLALIEARALGMQRTAAITGVATRLLAPGSVRIGALIGTGPQAVTQLAALAAIRAWEEIRVYSPTPEKREAFVQRLAGRYPFVLKVCDSLEHALEGAEVVTTITRAVEPFVYADHLQACSHINAVGAILPGKSEISAEVMRQADLIVVDDKENAHRGSQELRDLLGTDLSTWGSVSTLSHLLATDFERPANARLTLFKGMGMGLSDLAVASRVYTLATQRGLGIPLPAQTRENLLMN